MALYGGDGSHYQPTEAVDEFSDFVILKATEGTIFVDRDCDNKYQRAKSQGKLLGVYGFADMTDPVAEANYFVDNIQGYIGEALLALDNETHTDVGFALAWLNQVYDRTRVRPLIYMSASTLKAADWAPVFEAGYALWEAGYPPHFDVPNPGTPKPDGSDMPYSSSPWPFATIWQYTSSAGTLDRDIAYMDAEAWHKFARGDMDVTEPVPEPTPEPEPTPPVEPPVVAPPVEEPVPPVVVPPIVVVKVTWKDTFLRVFHTFWQTFLGTFMVSVTGLLANVLNIHTYSDAKTVAISFIIAAGAAGWSTVKNMIKMYKEKQI